MIETLTMIWLIVSGFVLAAGLALMLSGDLIDDDARVMSARMLVFCWAWPVLLMWLIATQCRVALRLLSKEVDDEKMP